DRRHRALRGRDEPDREAEPPALRPGREEPPEALLHPLRRGGDGRERRGGEALQADRAEGMTGPRRKLPVISTNENAKACSSCGGSCCKTYPGISVPGDFG